MATRKGSGQKAKGKDLSSSPKPMKDFVMIRRQLITDLDQKVESLKGRKHPLDDEEDAGPHEGGQVVGMLDKFGADVSKAFVAKRQRVETFAKTITKSCQQKMEQHWEAQQKERSKVADDYSSQLNVVLNQWDTDMVKAKEQQDKMMTMFQQQQKVFQQMRVSQRQRLNTLKQLLDQYTQALEAVEKTHNGQQETIQSELRQEVAMLQKKVLMDTQQQDMAAMRKSLQSMMAMM